MIRRSDMNHLDKIVEHFMRMNKKLKRWQRGVSALAAIVVFVTTYTLILPAVTLDVNTASTQAGIDIAESEPVVTESAEEVEPEEEGRGGEGWGEGRPASSPSANP
jgi:hypothetical protein